MARRSRYRGGGPYRGVYKARTVADVARKPTRRAPSKPARPRGQLPAPHTKSARSVARQRWAMLATYGREASWPAEARQLKHGALYDALGRREYAGYGDLWREYQADVYRRLYNAQQRERRKVKSTGRPAKRSPWIRVRAHRRRRRAA